MAAAVGLVVFSLIGLGLITADPAQRPPAEAQPLAAPLSPIPDPLVKRCERLGSRKAFRVLCPRSLPVAPGKQARPGNHAFERDRDPGSYFIEYQTGFSADPGDLVGHVLVGGQARRFRLEGPPYGASDTLGIADRRRFGQRPPRIVARSRVNGRRGVVLAAAPYPAGGIHGGHVLVMWNEAGAGYLVSVHGPPGRDELRPGLRRTYRPCCSRADVAAVALAVAADMAPAARR